MDQLIANAAELAGTGMRDLRALALRVAGAGLEACDVRRATADAVTVTRDGVAIAGEEYLLDRAGRLVVVGSGKATLAIVKTLERILGDRLDGGVIAVRDVTDGDALERVEVLLADHPLPTSRSEGAARRIIDLVDGLGPSDLVIAAFTGGSSALTSLAPAGVTQADKRRLHELLLGSGASIVDVNTVRKHVSSFKGGRLAAHVAPARLVSLVVSDVAGDLLDVTSDPSVQDTTSVSDALEVIHRRDLWSELPASIREHLTSADAHSPELTGEPHAVLLVHGAGVCDAMAAEARSSGVSAHVVSTQLQGEASVIGDHLAGLGVECEWTGKPIAPPCVLVGCGGESTVTLAPEGSGGKFGDGGPNQEAAAAAALRLESGNGVSVCFLDTDGSDGGTGAAGAIIDGLTAERARSAGVDLAGAVADHRSGEVMAALGDQILTGPTHTNVNDLFVVAVGSAADL
ncbi:MAG: glycerate 2-kinase [Solirubrobacterales bacterium]|jgi:glycerate-2-kinase|nr:glycerate 2-kinase [Solirubrobacterales bacterium]